MTLLQTQPQKREQPSELDTTKAKEIAEEYKGKQEQLTKLEAALGKIPESVAKVDKRISPENPTTTFVVIREMHHNEKMPADVQKAALRCQGELGVVLQKIKENMGSYSVLKDGMDPSIAESYTQRIEHFYKHAETVKTLEEKLGLKSSKDSAAILAEFQKAKADPKLINALGFLMEYQKNRESLFEDAKTDVAINLALKKSIALAGPEDRKLVQQSLDLANKNPLITVDDPTFKAISDKREAHIISEVVKEKKTVVVGIFGGSHDFSEEITAWNKKNPERKVALIEITPKEYSSYFKE